MNESVPQTAAEPVLILTYYDIPGLPEGPLISFAIRIFIVLPSAPTLRLWKPKGGVWRRVQSPPIRPAVTDQLDRGREGGGIIVTLTLQRRANEFPAKIPPGASEKIPGALSTWLLHRVWSSVCSERTEPRWTTEPRTADSRYHFSKCSDSWWFKASKRTIKTNVKEKKGYRLIDKVWGHMLEDYQVLTRCLKAARLQTWAQFQPIFNLLNPHETTHLSFVDTKAATMQPQDLTAMWELARCGIIYIKQGQRGSDWIWIIK